MLLHDLSDRVTAKRRFADQQKIKRAAETVDIRPRIGLLRVLPLLGSHKRGRAQNRSHRGSFAALERRAVALVRRLGDSLGQQKRLLDGGQPPPRLSDGAVRIAERRQHVGNSADGNRASHGSSGPGHRGTRRGKGSVAGAADLSEDRVRPWATRRRRPDRSRPGASRLRRQRPGRRVSCSRGGLDRRPLHRSAPATAADRQPDRHPQVRLGPNRSRQGSAGARWTVCFCWPCYSRPTGPPAR